MFIFEKCLKININLLCFHIKKLDTEHFLRACIFKWPYLAHPQVTITAYKRKLKFILACSQLKDSQSSYEQVSKDNDMVVLGHLKRYMRLHVEQGQPHNPWDIYGNGNWMLCKTVKTNEGWIISFGLDETLFRVWFPLMELGNHNSSRTLILQRAISVAGKGTRLPKCSLNMQINKLVRDLFIFYFWTFDRKGSKYNAFTTHPK